MHAVSMLARSEGRRRRGSLVVITLMVALVAGGVLATVSGARRTATVLDRFYEATAAPAGMVGFFEAEGTLDDTVTAVAHALEGEDGVESVAVARTMLADPGTEYDFSLLTGPDSRYLEVGRPLVVDGRLPALDRPGEVALRESTSLELGLTVGDRLVAPTMSPETFAALVDGAGGFDLDGPQLELEVVGVVRDVDDLRPEGRFSSPLGYASPALHDRRDEIATGGVMYLVTGDPEEIDGEALFEVIGAAVSPGTEVFGGIGPGDADSLEVAFDSLANGLLVFAALAACAGLLALALAIGRHLQQGRADGTVASSVGATRVELVAAWTVPLVVAVSLGLATGAVLSWAASPIFPISIARRAETASGPWIDAPVTALTALALAAVLVVVTCALAWRQSAALHRLDRRRAVRSRPTRIGRLQRQLPPPASVGVSSVLASTRSRLVSPAAAIAGAAVAVAGLVGVATFVESQRVAADEPVRYGTPWDSRPDLDQTLLLGAGDDPIGRLVDELVADERIDAVGGIFCDIRPVLGRTGAVCALQAMGGSLAPVITDGRAPSSPDEIALGAVTAASEGVELGDTVELARADGTTQQMHVVGEVVLPPIHDDRPGLGAVVTLEAVRVVAGVDDIYTLDGSLVLSYSPGLDPAVVEAGLAEDHPALMFTTYSEPAAPELVVQLGRLRTLLVVLAAFLGAIAVVGLLHYLVLSTRRRRSEVAVLQALGFVPRQVRRAVTTQAVTVAVVGLVVGTPLGIVVGRRVWLALVDDLGMIDTPATPWSVVVATPIVFVAGAVALGWYPGWRASRVPPAEPLREE